MKDATFWIVPAVGFVSGLLGAVVGAWLQFRFKIKEHEYQRRQERIDRETDRETEERSRRELERKELIAMISDLRPDIKASDDWRRIMSHSESYKGRYHGESGFYSMHKWYEGYDDLDWLGRMSLSELRSLYTTIMSTLSLWPVAMLFNDRAREIEQRADQISEMLRHARGNQPNS